MGPSMYIRRWWGQNIERKVRRTRLVVYFVLEIERLSQTLTPILD
jgi:hypothetical protein